ncbi:MAG TPA: Uma2 family endonuclease [Acetobacteraceae bacterium]|nr:Uma2 family endonuclease [Acetobacteraceae bacterium]
MPKAQTIEPVQSMTREEYRAWAERQPVGRFERIDGVVVAMAPERVEHNDRKMLAWLALRRAIRDAGVPCHVQGDGMTVEVGDSDYEPDAVVYCGERLAVGSLTVPEPLIVVEVLSPSTSATDRAWKLREYFRLPSLRHYLIVWADRQQIVHHRRDDAGATATALLTGGEIRLDPPGIAFSVEEIYAD